jgi:DNA polymerase V
MSNRVVEVLAGFSPRMEVYSIDESFLDLSGFGELDRVTYGQQMRRRILRWLGLPVCVGIAPTKTLAKLANHIAKKQERFDGVCDLGGIPADEQARLFAGIAVGEVWGVGRRIEAGLAELGIGSVEDLRRADPERIRGKFSVVLERTVRELNGVSCLALEELAPEKQQIMASRSFGSAVFHLEELQEAVASHLCRAAEKLRAQHLDAGAVMVMIRTNPFKPTDPQYQRSVTVPLPSPTSDSRVLIAAAHAVLGRIFRAGLAYQKAGVMLSELVPVRRRQAGLFDGDENRHKASAVMAVMDAINQRWGRGTLHPSATGIEQSWRMRRERLSPAYTTSWEDLPVVRAR